MGSSGFFIGEHFQPEHGGPEARTALEPVRIAIQRVLDRSERGAGVSVEIRSSVPVAAHAYYELAKDGKPDIIVIFSPSHTGRGSALAVMNEGVWRTPLGNVEIDAKTADQILRESRIIDVDDRAHAYEHSIELQLPFLQYLYGSTFKFVPICFLMQDLEFA